MNKKIATLLFAIGLGAAAAPAFASCEFYCASDYRVCVAGGWSVAECAAEHMACLRDMCGYDY